MSEEKNNPTDKEKTAADLPAAASVEAVENKSKDIESGIDEHLKPSENKNEVKTDGPGQPVGAADPPAAAVDAGIGETGTGEKGAASDVPAMLEESVVTAAVPAVLPETGQAPGSAAAGSPAAADPIPVIRRDDLERLNVDADSLAMLFNVSTPRVSQIVKELDIRIAAGKGRLERKYFNLVEAVSAFVNFQRSRMRAPAAKVGEKKKEKSVDLQNELMEIRLARELGELVPAKDVEREWEKIVVATRQKILGLPSKLARELALATEPMKVQYMLDNAIREAMNDLSIPEKTNEKKNKPEPAPAAAQDAGPVPAATAS